MRRTERALVFNESWKQRQTKLEAWSRTRTQTQVEPTNGGAPVYSSNETWSLWSDSKAYSGFKAYGRGRGVVSFLYILEESSATRTTPTQDWLGIVDAKGCKTNIIYPIFWFIKFIKLLSTAPVSLESPTSLCYIHTFSSGCRLSNFGNAHERSSLRNISNRTQLAMDDSSGDNAAEPGGRVNSPRLSSHWYSSHWTGQSWFGTPYIWRYMKLKLREASFHASIQIFFFSSHDSQAVLQRSL